MRNTDRALIRKLPLFAEMREDNFEPLLAAAFLQRFPEGVALINEGEHPDFLHVVVDGEVELFARSGDRQTTIDVIYPVTTFVLAAVIRDEVYLKSGRTLAPSQILMIPATVLRDVFDRDAAFARAVVRELADRYRSLVRELKNQKLRTGTERLANWILKAKSRQGGEGPVKLTYDKRTLAAQLGMTAENLSRNFQALEKHGVSNQGRNIIISDRAALERCAKPNALIDG